MVITDVERVSGMLSGEVSIVEALLKRGHATSAADLAGLSGISAATMPSVIRGLVSRGILRRGLYGYDLIGLPHGVEEVWRWSNALGRLEFVRLRATNAVDKP